MKCRKRSRTAAPAVGSLLTRLRDTSLTDRRRDSSCLARTQHGDNRHVKVPRDRGLGIHGWHQDLFVAIPFLLAPSCILSVSDNGKGF